MNSGQKILNQLNKRLDYLSDHSKETERHKRTRAYLVVLFIIEILLLDKHMYFTIYNTAVIAIALGYTVWLSVITFSAYNKTNVVNLCCHTSNDTAEEACFFRLGHVREYVGSNNF